MGFSSWEFTQIGKGSHKKWMLEKGVASRHAKDRRLTYWSLLGYYYHPPLCRQRLSMRKSLDCTKPREILKLIRPEPVRTPPGDLELFYFVPTDFCAASENSRPADSEKPVLSAQSSAVLIHLRRKSSRCGKIWMELREFLPGELHLCECRRGNDFHSPDQRGIFADFFRPSRARRAFNGFPPHGLVFPIDT